MSKFCIILINQINCSWWDVNGEMGALHSLNELRVPFIRDCLLYQVHVSLALIRAMSALKSLKNTGFL